MATPGSPPGRQLCHLGPSWLRVQQCLLGPLSQTALTSLLQWAKQNQPALLQELDDLSRIESVGWVWNRVDAILTPELSSATSDLERCETLQSVARLFHSLRREFAGRGRGVWQLQETSIKRVALAEIPLASVVRHQYRHRAALSPLSPTRSPRGKDDVIQGFRDSKSRMSKYAAHEGASPRRSFYDKMEQSPKKATPTIGSDIHQRRKNAFTDDKENTFASSHIEYPFVDKVKVNLSKLFAKLAGDDAAPSCSRPEQRDQRTPSDVTATIWDLFSVEDLKDKSRSLVPAWVELIQVAQEVLWERSGLEDKSGLDDKSGLEALQEWIQVREELLSEQLLLLASAKLAEEEVEALEEALPGFVRQFHVLLHRRLQDDLTSQRLEAQAWEEGRL